MNPYIWPCTCDVCGEEGVAHASCGGATWFHKFRHTDPEVCAENLRRKKEELDKLEKRA